MVELERIREIAERVAGSEGLELVTVEWHGSGRHRVLRIFIDRPEGGVSHRDCEVVSQQVGTILDVEDLIPYHYVLEVASPGLDRKLYRPADYERFSGRRVKVRLKHRSATLGRKNLEGRLVGYAEGLVRLEVDGQEVTIPYAEIAQTNLVFEWKQHA
ncbi:MAG: ribosome maturation factor RimP [Acidobacteria bacterium]|nr:ribosome maturation factor RimP [Acidobacteriota bacterium]